MRMSLEERTAQLNREYRKRGRRKLWLTVLSLLVVLGTLALLGTVQKAVVRHDQVGPCIDSEILVKLLGNLLKLLSHGVEVHDCAYADDACCLRIEDSGRNNKSPPGPVCAMQQSQTV